MPAKIADMDNENYQQDNRIDPRLIARGLFWQGWKITAIAKHLSLKPATVQSWKTREQWDADAPMKKAATSIEARIVRLSNIPELSDGQLNEIRQLSKTLRDFYQPKNNHEMMAGPTSAPTQKTRKQTPTKNHFNESQTKRLSEILHESLFDYQRLWYEAGLKYDFRHILKSRQIGATFYFAREALVDAVKTGRNQIFLSASRAQAYQFKTYIQNMANQVDVELKGEVIILSNGAELHFLGTNSRTAQGRHGNLYVDEIFWIPKFQQLRDLADPIASQKMYRSTYFSTPSTEAHEAFPFWTGELFNEGRPKTEHIKLDVSHSTLKGGLYCPDGQWRNIVTIDDALAGGCNLFNLDKLKLRFSPETFEQLYRCAFMHDGEAIFPLAFLQSCRVDSWDEWRDFHKPFAIRPLGNTPVWIGYDPSDTGDAAGLVVILPPQVNGGCFRVIESERLFGNDYETQAARIKEMTKKYNVEKIVIDIQGLGSAVYQLVQKFFPLAIGVRYTPESKAYMVLKTQQLIKTSRLEFDAGNRDFITSFMTIRRTITPKSAQITYTAGRTKEGGHADLAFAAMQLFVQEPIDGSVGGQSTIEVFG